MKVQTLLGRRAWRNHVCATGWSSKLSVVEPTVRGADRWGRAQELAEGFFFFMV